MSLPLLFAQASSVKPKPIKAQTVTSAPADFPVFWASASGGLVILLIGIAVFGKLKFKQLEKKVRIEQFRTQEVQKQLKLALETIRRIEENPDLINSRELNLDYLRMRMAEEVFHFAIISQIKAKIKDKISQALRPANNHAGVVGIASNSGGKQVDEIVEVEYETGVAVQKNKCVLFRVQIRLAKLPIQTTSATVKDIIDCIETYLSPAEDHDNWQPTIQGRLVYIHWDQKAKPTPLLLMEQSNEGVNVSFRTQRSVKDKKPFTHRT
jgi:hypothetical protein